MNEINYDLRIIKGLLKDFIFKGLGWKMIIED